MYKMAKHAPFHLYWQTFCAVSAVFAVRKHTQWEEPMCVCVSEK
jgi:hypothetical protein